MFTLNQARFQPSDADKVHQAFDSVMQNPLSTAEEIRQAWFHLERFEGQMEQLAGDLLTMSQRTTRSLSRVNNLYGM